MAARDGQPAWAYEMELSLVREIQGVRDMVPGDDKIRILAREEMGLATRGKMTTRSFFAAAGMLIVAVSTFVMTALRGTGHA